MKRFRSFVIVALLGAILTACPNPFLTGPSFGSLKINISDGVSRTLLPGISMEPASYDVTGSGPGGAAFSETVTGSASLTVEGLPFGPWTVTVTARNADGIAIGSGSGAATVISNAASSLYVTVRPISGTGTLSLSLAWPAEQVQTAQVMASLLSTEGANRTLDFTVDAAGGTAAWSASDVATGYHTLILKLRDNGRTVKGAVEIVRIVKDQVTSGSFRFDPINQATGSLEVHITPEMDDPLQVSIEGGSATRPVDQPLSLSAVVTGFAGAVSCIWYVNGDAVETGAEYVFGDGWPLGWYRVDVTAFSADGRRAGSAGIDIEVVGPSSPGTESLDIHAQMAVGSLLPYYPDQYQRWFQRLVTVSGGVPAWEPVALGLPGESIRAQIDLLDDQYEMSDLDFEYRIDGAAFAPSGNAVELHVAGEGPHVVSMKVIDRATLDFKVFTETFYVYAYDPEPTVVMDSGFGGDFVLTEGVNSLTYEPNSVQVVNPAVYVIYGQNFCIHRPGADSVVEVGPRARLMVRGSNVNVVDTQTAHFHFSAGSLTIIRGSNFAPYVAWVPGALVFQWGSNIYPKGFE